MKQSTLGILIGKKNYSESSLILSFYTKEVGLSSFIFKGAKKKKLPIFYTGIYEISYFKRPDSNLGIIQSMEQAVVLTDTFSNPQKLILSFFMVEVLKETLKEEQQDKQIFDFVRDQILKLESQENLLLFPIEFLTVLIQYLGFSPVIDIENPKGFDLRKSQFTEEVSEFDVAPVQLLNQIFMKLQVHSEKNTAQKALTILLDYYKVHLPNFQVDKSLKVIKETLYI